MKPINIYAITRVSDEKHVRRFEKQMSERESFLHVKKWEFDGLGRLVDHLCLVPEDYDKMEFYYSFQIPKLGKEFDLLQISEDTIVNIELKSEAVPEEKIRKQLLLNKHYLASLGKNIYSFTYISSTDQLYRLTHSDRLVEAEWERVTKLLQPRNVCFTGNVEDLFLEENYLISPLTDPDRFLRRDYFLTSQQKDIRQKIINNIQKEHRLFQGFTGLPGTGKTLLLYDIAMQLSKKQKVCVLHFGSFPEEMERLDQILKRIDFFQAERLEDLLQEKMREYSYICVDEGHRVSAEQLSYLQAYAMEQKCPVIFSYDLETVVSPLERKEDTAFTIEALPDFVAYRLTNRIRTNSELSNFIQSIFMLNAGRRRNHYQSVTVMYAQNEYEAEMFLKDFRKQGYIYLYQEGENRELVDSLQNQENENKEQVDSLQKQESENRESVDGMRKQESENREQGVCIQNQTADDDYRMDAAKATCKEFENVVMLLGEEFFYDEESYLRTKHRGEVCGQRVQTLDVAEEASTGRKQEAAKMENLAGKKQEVVGGADLKEKCQGESPVRILFHGLSRAKSRLALIIVNNPEVFGEILNVIQGPEK